MLRSWAELEALVKATEPVTVHIPPVETQNAAALAKNEEQDSASPSQAAVLVKLAEPVELWHDADNNAFGTVLVKDHYENWPLNAKRFREWLCREFYRTTKRKPPTAQAMQDAAERLERQGGL